MARERSATRNEHLAVRQRLADVYQEQLDVVRRRILADWQQGLERIDQVAASEPPAAAFADCVRQGLSDSVILVDAEGNAVYPALAPPRIEPLESNVQWLAAERLEFAVHDPPRPRRPTTTSPARRPTTPLARGPSAPRSVPSQLPAETPTPSSFCNGRSTTHGCKRRWPRTGDGCW